MSYIYVFYQQNFRLRKVEEGSISGAVAYDNFIDCYADFLNAYSNGYNNQYIESEPENISIDNVKEHLEADAEFVVSFDCYKEESEDDNYQYSLIIKRLFFKEDDSPKNVYLTYIENIKAKAFNDGDFAEEPDFRTLNKAVLWLKDRTMHALKFDEIYSDFLTQEDKLIIFDFYFCNSTNSLGDKLSEESISYSFKVRNDHNEDLDYDIVAWKLEVR